MYSDIIEAINNRIRQDNETGHVISDLSQYSDPYIIGGFIRDIIMGTPFKDIDIVLGNVSSSTFSVIESKYKHQKNKYGGYKIYTHPIEIDVWDYRKSFILNFDDVSLNTPLDLMKYTFFNLDAIMFDVKRNKLYMTPDYMNDIKEKKLKLNFTKHVNYNDIYSKMPRFNKRFNVSDDVNNFFRNRMLRCM